jgi:hypothetical protein
MKKTLTAREYDIYLENLGKYFLSQSEQVDLTMLQSQMREISLYPEGTRFKKTDVGYDVLIPESAFLARSRKELQDIETFPIGIRQIAETGYFLQSGMYALTKPIAGLIGKTREHDLYTNIATSVQISPFQPQKQIESVIVGEQKGRFGVHHVSLMDYVFEPIGWSPKGSTKLLMEHPITSTVGGAGAEYAQGVAFTQLFGLGAKGAGYVTRGVVRKTVSLADDIPFLKRGTQLIGQTDVGENLYKYSMKGWRPIRETPLLFKEGVETILTGDGVQTKILEKTYVGKPGLFFNRGKRVFVDPSTIGKKTSANVFDINFPRSGDIGTQYMKTYSTRRGLFGDKVIMSERVVTSVFDDVGDNVFRSPVFDVVDEPGRILGGGIELGDMLDYQQPFLSDRPLSKLEHSFMSKDISTFDEAVSLRENMLKEVGGSTPKEYVNFYPESFLEPQVRESVSKLNKAGLITDQSGFVPSNPRYSFISFKTKLTDDIVDIAKKQGLDVVETPKGVITFAQFDVRTTGKNLDEIKKSFDSFTSELLKQRGYSSINPVQKDIDLGKMYTGFRRKSSEKMVEGLTPGGYTTSLQPYTGKYKVFPDDELTKTISFESSGFIDDVPIRREYTFTKKELYDPLQDVGELFQKKNTQRIDVITGSRSTKYGKYIDDVTVKQGGVVSASSGKTGVINVMQDEQIKAWAKQAENWGYKWQLKQRLRHPLSGYFKTSDEATVGLTGLQRSIPEPLEQVVSRTSSVSDVTVGGKRWYMKSRGLQELGRVMVPVHGVGRLSYLGLKTGQMIMQEQKTELTLVIDVDRDVISRSKRGVDVEQIIRSRYDVGVKSQMEQLLMPVQDVDMDMKMDIKSETVLLQQMKFDIVPVLKYPVAGRSFKTPFILPTGSGKKTRSDMSYVDVFSGFDGFRFKEHDIKLLEVL